MRRDSVSQPSRGRTAARLVGELAGFSLLLFITRFGARGHLMPQSDQECHIGGIAVDVLAHGVRFPLLVYAPNDYDNGSFFSGLLAAASFRLLGRSVLALKLVTHVITAAGAVATLSLLRSCLRDLGLASRQVRWVATTVLVITIALAPRMVTLSSMYAVGNHAEGTAIDVLLLALYASRWPGKSTLAGAAFWLLAGIAVYLNKGTVLVIPVLAVAEIALARGVRQRLAAASGGFVLGLLPELLAARQRYGVGWTIMASKAEHGAHAFPQAFVDSVLTLAEHRPELLAAWTLALAVGTVWLARSLRRFRRTSRIPAQGTATLPVAVGLTVGVTWLYLAALSVMAQGGVDAYVNYGYPTLAVLYALLIAGSCARVRLRWGAGAAMVVGGATIALTLALYRPDAVTWGVPRLIALSHNRAGAACSWRLAEGFERERDAGITAPEETRAQHAVTRCRTLSDRDQILDCIGGIARELNWRQLGRVEGEPPAALDAVERRAYAYAYGTHRMGDTGPCADFHSAELAADCTAAVRLECLVFADMLTRYASGQDLGPPHCVLPPPPMDGYWDAMRRDLLARTGRTHPQLSLRSGDSDLGGCQWVFDECY